MDGLNRFGFCGVGDVDEGGVASAVREAVGVGDEELTVVVEECETDRGLAAGIDRAQERVGGVLLEGGGVEDENFVVAASDHVDGASVGGDGGARRGAACVDEAQN